MQALGPMKWLEPVNWKTLVDNCSDNYHVPTSHLSSARVQTRFLGRPRLSHEDQFASPNKHAFVNGHAITFRDADDNPPRYVHGVSSETMQLFQDYHEATMPEVERRLGTLRARRVQLGNHSIFPNGILGLRLALPRGPLKTEFWHFVLLDRDAPEELKRVIRIGSQANNGAAGMFEQDDVDNWRQVTQASTSRFGRQHAAGSVDGRRARRAASGLSRAGLRALHLGEQPAPLLSALGEFMNARAGPTSRSIRSGARFRRHRDDAAARRRSRLWRQRRADRPGADGRSRRCGSS